MMFNLHNYHYLRKQLLISTCLNLGYLLVGYQMGWSPPIINKLQDPNQTPLQELISDRSASWVEYALMIGAIIGPIIVSLLLDAVGRKKCMIIGGIINIAAQVPIAMSKNIETLMVGRVMAGIGISIITVCNTVYIGEIASTNVRGVILATAGIFITLGTLMMYITGPYLSYPAISYVVIGVAVFHIFGILFMPESPVYHVLKGNVAAAHDSLKSLGRKNEIDNIIEDLKQNEEEKKPKIKELFTIKSNQKSLFITVGTSILQQTTGIVATVYFSENIFELSGVAIDTSLATIIMGITQFSGTLIVPTMIEILGRKALLLMSLGGSFMTMTVIGGYFFLINDEDDTRSIDSLIWIPLTALILSFFVYGIGLSIIPNTLIGEMFESNCRSIGSSSALSIGTLTGLLSTTTFDYMTTSIGEAFTFWIFSVVNCIGIVFTLFVVPETKGMSLFDIREMLKK